MLIPTTSPAALAAMLCLAAWPAGGATFYVDQSHRDASDANSGTQALPFLTVQKAADVAGPGDTVYIKTGTYAPFEVTNSGSEGGGYITFSAAPGHELSATIDGTGSSLNSGECIYSAGQSYIAIRDLRVVHCGRNGIRIEGREAVSTGFRISGNYVAFTASAGISLRGEMLNSAGIDGLRDAIIEHNEVTRTNEPDGHNEAISVGDGLDGFIIRFNHVHHSDQFGIDAKRGARSGQIYGNRIHDMERHGIYLDTSTYYVTDVEVFGNEIYNNNHGIVMTRENDSSGPARLERIRVYNNLLYDNRKDGVLLYRHAYDKTGLGRFDNISIINNTIFRNGRIGINLAASIAPLATNVKMQNNISWGNTDKDLVNGIGAVEATNLINLDPLFESESPVDLRLVEASPAIDAGTAGNAPTTDFLGTMRPQGLAHDIGAIEFVSEQPSPASITASLTAMPDTVEQGQSVTLEWTSPGAETCDGTGFTTGGAISGSVVATPDTDTTYEIVCRAIDAEATDQAAVTVFEPPTSRGPITVSLLPVMDTTLKGRSPGTSFGRSSALEVDLSDGGAPAQGLMKFDLSSLPAGAIVQSATLTLRTTNPGDGGSVHEILVPWSEMDTWDSLNAGLSANDTEAAIAASLVTGFVNIGVQAFDVRAGVQEWINGRANHGWAFLPVGGNGWDFNSREGSAPPVLEITYVPPG